MGLSVLKYIANTNTMAKLEKWALKEKPLRSNPSIRVTNYSKLQNAYPMAFGLFIGLVQIVSLYNSKDLPKERKIPLLLNIANTTAIALIGGTIMNKPVQKFLNKVLKRAEVIYAKNPNKSIYINGIKTAVPFAFTALLFKYIGAVLATPLADKSNKLLVKWGLVNYSDKT